jgi:hypothetical protein
VHLWPVSSPLEVLPAFSNSVCHKWSSLAFLQTCGFHSVLHFNRCHHFRVRLKTSEPSLTPLLYSLSYLNHQEIMLAQPSNTCWSSTLMLCYTDLPAFFFCFFFGSTEVSIRAPCLLRQVLYHLSESLPQLVLILRNS